MRNFRDIKVWEKAHKLALQMYRITKRFPSDERFSLVSQLRRSAASIPANIAEGCGRSGDRELSRFMSIAAGSASETEYHLILAHDLGYLKKSDFAEFDKQINEIKRMLNSFMKHLAANT